MRASGVILGVTSSNKSTSLNRTVALPEESRSLAGVAQMLGKAIPEIAFEGIEAWDKADVPAGRRGRSRRGGTKTTGGRPERARPRREPAPRKAAAEAKPAPEETAEIDDEEMDATGGTVAQPKPRAAKPQSGRRRTKAGSERTDMPFGEHTPAFMLREVKVA